MLRIKQPLLHIDTLSAVIIAKFAVKVSTTELLFPTTSYQELGDVVQILALAVKVFFFLGGGGGREV